MVVALLVGGATASAEVSPRRSPTARTRTTAKSPVKTDKAAAREADKAKLLAAVDRTAPDAVDPTDPTDATDATGPSEPLADLTPVASLPAPARSGRPPPPPTSASVSIQYQRIGRELMKLQESRGTSCTLELREMFRAIKLEANLTSAHSRTLLATTLGEMQLRIERMRGITIHKACLDNPLAQDCQ